MSVTEHECGCGETFAAPGTVHGQPAGLWQLLEHQSTRHPEGNPVTIPAIAALAAWQSPIRRAEGADHADGSLT